MGRTRLQVLMVLATMILFVVMLAANEWLFTKLEFAPGISYNRSEAVLLPVQTNDLYRVFVTTDFEANVYEGTGAEGNNTASRAEPIAISARPRADLQVQTLTVPDRVPAGGTLTADFVIINQGTAATDVPNWVDKVYLSPDTKWWPWLLPTAKLEMGWCIQCHRENNASQDCVTCHY